MIVLLGVVAVTGSAALRRAREDAERLGDEQSALRELATLVAAGASGEEVFAACAQSAGRLLRADAAAVVCFHAPATMRVEGSWSSGGATLPPGSLRPVPPGSELAALQATGAAVLRGSQAPGSAIASLGYAAVAAGPVVLDGALWGAIMVSSARDHGLPAGAAEGLADFGALVSTALAKAAERELLRRDARADPLTGLGNRRTFEQRLAEELALAAADGRALSVAIVDIDRFKSVNDGAGHAAGDEVLRAVATRLADGVRGQDLAARIGGDEFGLILTTTTAGEAVDVLERLRSDIAALELPGGVRATISAGVCELGEADDPEALVRLADDALYRAKAQGRDAVARHRAAVLPGA